MIENGKLPCRPVRVLYYGMCSLAVERVANKALVSSRMCSLAIECVLLLQNVFSCYRACCEKGASLA